MKFEKTLLITDINNLAFKPTDVVAEEEAQHLVDLLHGNQTLSERLESYRDPSIRGIGGSGIVLRATYNPTGFHRALKFPRHRQRTSAMVDADPIDIDPELRALEKLSHQNITRLYEAIPLRPSRGHCMITEYVSDAKSLEHYARDLCCNTACRTSLQALLSALRKLAMTIYQIADALYYMHNVARLLHFDVKPDNILVTPDGTAYVTDLGFARELGKYPPEDKVEVGFTWRYAHPRLTQPHDGARVSKVPQRAKKPLLGKELHAIFDIFAFGRTLQEVLGLLDAEYREHIHSLYTFGFLHVLACLCLDGSNSSAKAESSSGNFIDDRAMGLPTKVFEASKFKSFGPVRICLQRLLGLRRFEDDLDEVDRWYGSTIKVSDVGTTTLTPRVSNIINHPALQRLKNEYQLGMLDSVFPTATHNRFQHTLGTYHAATQYLAALYYDPDNPTFRALVDIDKCKALLVATLVHDVGHTAYGHELEEIDHEEFDHTEFGKNVLRSTSFRDDKGRTLSEVIEKFDDGCWGISVQDVLNLLERDSAPAAPIDGILRDIIDSQIDADKFDYLIRDSIECRVNYGLGIDYDRFLRSLTTHAKSDGVLRLAVKQKGAASVEAFALARYQLYQSLYWHHTFRATKAMFLEAARLITNDLQKSGRPDMFDLHPLRTAYLREAIGVREYAPEEMHTEAKSVSRKKSTTRKSDEAKSIGQVIQERLAVPAKGDITARYRHDQTMSFLWRLSTKEARRLLEDLTTRNYYKRIMEVSPAELSWPDWDRLRDKFKGQKNRTEIQDAVQSELYNSLRTLIQSTSLTRSSLVEDRTLERLEAIWSEKAIFLVDIPLRGWFASNECPVYVSDYKRRHFRTKAAELGYEGKEKFWIETLGGLMKEIAFIRVFCEPEIHSIVTRVMNAADIVKAVRTAIPELNPRTH